MEGGEEDESEGERVRNIVLLYAQAFTFLIYQLMMMIAFLW